MVGQSHKSRSRPTTWLKTRENRKEGGRHHCHLYLAALFLSKIFIALLGNGGVSCAMNRLKYWIRKKKPRLSFSFVGCSIPVDSNNISRRGFMGRCTLISRASGGKGIWGSGRRKLIHKQIWLTSEAHTNQNVPLTTVKWEPLRCVKSRSFVTRPDQAQSPSQASV